MFKQVSPHFHTCVTMFGDAWILLIATELLKQPRRFSELQRTIDDISPATLSDRLKKLETYGLIERTKEGEGKLAITYVLTERGKALEPVVRSISDYAEQHLHKD
jgi:DNA-binding HxlR family transcriptional regulator